MSSKKKKAVSQEELRRLMREKQRATERQKRVQSPFAKYTGSGRLVCTLCGEHVKSEAVWQAHVLGRGHKERVGRLKQEGQGAQEGGQGLKPEQGQGGLTGKRRKDEEEEGQASKKVKQQEKKQDEENKKSAGLPADFFQTKGSAGLGLLAGQYGDDEDEEEEKKKEDEKDEGSKSSTAGLPADFFESSLPPDEETEGKAEPPPPPPPLPEGFFDDPVRDARVRNVDTPREQMDREWEEFQKEMRMVNTASDAIVAEDDEEGRIERQIDEIDEQIECLRRVELLRARQEAAQGRTDKQVMQEDLDALDGGEGAEEDEEELLHVLSRDWRAKGALV